MRTKSTATRRVIKFLGRLFEKGKAGWDYSDAPDPGQSGKVKHSMGAILYAMELGLLSNQPTLRDVEQQTGMAEGLSKTLIPSSISDTTLDTEAQRLNSEYLHSKLIARVRYFHRSKMLEPYHLPCGVLTVDGKNLATLDHDANGSAQPRSKENEKWHPKDKDKGEPYFLMPALRATLTSTAARPCVYQHLLPVGTGEATQFKDFLAGLQKAYGRSQMFKIIEGDAGLTSLENANLIMAAGYLYVFGLKGNQGELFTHAASVLMSLAAGQPPEAQTMWERRNGKRIRRQLWRTGFLEGFENTVGKWSHLRQTWLVRQETESGGQITVEDRYFITAIDWHFLSPIQILLLVRNHWGVEVTFNSLDLQWREDSAPWCTRGEAIPALGIIRLMAYNMAQIFRCCRLRGRKQDGTKSSPVTWRTTFKIIEHALQLNVECCTPG